MNPDIESLIVGLGLMSPFIFGALVVIIYEAITKKEFEWRNKNL